MTDRSTFPDVRRFQAHADLFDRLSKLRTLLSMLHASGFEHFRALEEVRQAEYLWTCLDYAEGAFKALTIWDGTETQDDAGLH
ncbi:hypothetical protein [uncultured Ralstonia sp.]|jgi:hypothetical protein|uniref:hypothetical protein n=1 Tax=Ralstonia sp. TaxID=54061 RepID=UPI001EAC1142|nr:hypothetical protein [uncultured Ralstonia sp.]UCF24213.1 MAG: hypothetical protein JSV72_01520 [Ralstonia sp.]